MGTELKHEILVTSKAPEKWVLPPEPKQTDVFLVEIGSIKILNRSRKEFGDIMDFAQEIGRIGLLNPPVVRRIDDTGTFELVNGERRLRAMMMLGWKRCPVTIKPDYAGNDLLTAEAELSENMHRKPYDEVERADNVKKIHDLKTKIYGEGGTIFKPTPNSPAVAGAWTPEKTASFMGADPKNTAKRLKLANYLTKHPEKRDEYRKLDLHTSVRKIKQDEHTQKTQARITSGEITVKSEVLCGDCLKLISGVSDNSQHLWLTDPPFGLDEIQTMLGATKGTSTTYTALVGASDNLSFDQAIGLLRALIPEIWRVLKPSSHFYIFSSGQLLIPLIPLLQHQGFEINENVLIWDKGKTTTPFKGLEYPSAYEPIIFGHKPPREKHLSDPTCSNILRFNSLHTTKKVHRFQKPTDLISHLIRNSTRPGDNVLDTFAGSGVIPRVAKELQRNGLGFELSQENWVRSQLVLEHGVVKAAEILNSD